MYIVVHDNSRNPMPYYIVVLPSCTTHIMTSVNKVIFPNMEGI